MRLTLRIAAAELLRLRWFSLFWIALLLAQMLLDGMCSATATHPDTLAALHPFVPLVNLVRLASAAALAAFIVHSDPLVGTTAFWFTRPVSPKQLFMAKSLLVLILLVLLPVAIETVLMSVLGVPQAASGAAFFTLIVLQLCFWVVPLYLAASFTADFSRYAALCVVSALIFLVILTLDAVSLLPIGFFPQPPVNAQSVLAVGAARLAAIVVFVLLGTAVLVHQYMTRRTRRSVLLLLLSFLAVAGVLRSGRELFKDIEPAAASIQLTGTWQGARQPADAKATRRDGEGLTLPSPGGDANGRSETLSYAEFNLPLPQDGGGFSVVERVFEAKIACVGGTMVETLEVPQPGPGTGAKALEESARRALELPVAEQEQTIAASIPVFLSDGAAPCTGSYSATAQLGTYLLKPSARMKLRPGERASSDLSVFVVGQISPGADSIEVGVIDRKGFFFGGSEAQLLEAHRFFEPGTTDFQYPPGNLPLFVLYHPELKTILFASTRSQGTTKSSGQMLTKRFVLTFRLPESSGADVPGWLTKAQLVRLDPQRTALQTASLRVAEAAL